MADEIDDTKVNPANKGRRVPRRFKDMGDGTYAEVMGLVFGGDGTTPTGAGNPMPVSGPLDKIVTQAPAVTASSAYASGNCIGPKMTFAAVSRAADLTGLVQMVQVFCKSAQTGAVDLVLFNADPSASTLTDKTALAIAAADFDKIIGVVHITDWTSLGTPSLGQALNLAMPYKPVSGTDTIYGVLVARSTPTFASTSDIKVAVKTIPD